MVCSGLLEYLREEYGLIPLVVPYNPLVENERLKEYMRRKEKP